MSVLIKNATMPSTCGNCKLALGRTTCLVCVLTGHIVDDFGKSPACPLEEVVHCKDCKYWELGFTERTYNWCCKNDRHTMQEHFCADGERRNDEHTD